MVLTSVLVTSAITIFFQPSTEGNLLTESAESDQAAILPKLPETKVIRFTQLYYNFSESMGIMR